MDTFSMSNSNTKKLLNTKKKIEYFQKIDEYFMINKKRD